MKKLRLFELFRGYGSQALALKKYGINYINVGGCEIDKYADIAHEAIHGYVKNFGDITKVITSELPDFDLCTYSFPCQTVSVAGKLEGLEEGSGTKSSLLWECKRIITVKNPKFLMMENVKNLVGKKFMLYFLKWLDVLDELGYNSYWKVINAKNCGIPQNRERVFCVSIRKDIDDGTFKFEDDFDSGVRLKDVLEDIVDKKYYLSDEMVRGFIEKSPQLGYVKTNNILKLGRVNSSQDGVIVSIEGISITHSAGHGNCPKILEANNLNMIGMLDIKGNESIRRVYEPGGLSPALTTMQGGNRQPKVIEGCRITGRNPDNPKSRVSGLSTVQMVEVNKDPGISNCLTTVQKDNYLLESPPFRIRKLTPRECFRLMGVSEEDINKIQASGLSNSQQYKLAGNSIVVDCMKFLKNLPCKSK